MGKHAIIHCKISLLLLHVVNFFILSVHDTYHGMHTNTRKYLIKYPDDESGYKKRSYMILQTADKRP